MTEVPYKIANSIFEYFAPYNISEGDIKIYSKTDLDMQNGRRMTQSRKALEKLVAKYPDCPIFLNHLAGFYAMENDEEKMFFYGKQVWDKFPDYLMSRINRARYAIKGNQSPTEVLQNAFNGATALGQLYPERKAFYPHEIVHFHQFLSMFFLENKDIEKALHHASIVLQIDPTNEECLSFALATAGVLSELPCCDSEEECDDSCTEEYDSAQ